jgi:hypothetical protein
VPSWLHPTVCFVAPLLWGLALSRVLAAIDRRRLARAHAPRTDYSI